MKDWRMAQSARTGLTSLVQIQGICREMPETPALEFRPLSRLSPVNWPLPVSLPNFITGNSICRIREFAGRIRVAIEIKTGV